MIIYVFDPIQALAFIIIDKKDMSDITIYWNIISQPSRAVKTLIDIGKIPCTFNSVDLLKQEQKNKQFLEIYPIGRVPLLKSGDYVLGESGAIMIYLC
jgi:glutathione S-transferase